MTTSDRQNFIGGKIVNTLLEIGEIGMLLIDREGMRLNSSEWTVVFTIGSPGASYVIFRGTHQKWCKFWARKLPSVDDIGWEDAWEGTNPFKEACRVVEGAVSD